MSEVVIRKYRSGDAVGINAMLTRYLPYERDEKFWVWINRLMGESIAFVAECDGKIIGHNAIIPRDMFINGENVKAGLAIHTFVDPDYRNKVFIFQITAKVYEYAAKEGFRIIYGFQNANYRAIVLKLEKWKQVAMFKSFERSTELPLPQLNDDINYTKIDGIDDIALFNIAEMYKPGNGISFLSGARYWLERYMLHPQKPYEIYSLSVGKEIKGYMVTKEYENNDTKYFHLLDYTLVSNDYMKHLLYCYMKLGKEKDRDILSVWQGAMDFRKEIDKNGFEQKGFESFLGVKILDNTVSNLDEILNINNWRLVMGDSDAF